MKKIKLIKELKKGEKSRFIKDFDREKFLNNLHQKYLKMNIDTRL